MQSRANERETCAGSEQASESFERAAHEMKERARALARVGWISRLFVRAASAISCAAHNTSAAACQISRAVFVGLASPLVAGTGATLLDCTQKAEPACNTVAPV